MTAREFRRVALRLPGVVESAHMGHPDFRVRARVIATLGSPDRGWAMVKLTVEQQELFVRTVPNAFVPVRGGWGRGGATNVRLSAAPIEAVREALTLAWRSRTEHARRPSDDEVRKQKPAHRRSR
jgi:hypothetical protein